MYYVPKFSKTHFIKNDRSKRQNDLRTLYTFSMKRVISCYVIYINYT